VEAKLDPHIPVEIRDSRFNGLWEYHSWQEMQWAC